MSESVSVEKLMNKKLITLTPEMEIEKAIDILVENEISGAPVIKDSNLVGIVSEKDLLSVLMGKLDKEFEVKVVSDVMNDDIETVKFNADIYELALKFITSKVRRFPVIDNNGSLVGQISCSDVIKYLSKNPK